MSFSPGQVIAAKYEVTRILGEGGMGLVYQAKHLELGVLVALKILRDEVMQDPEAVRRFYREAQAAAALSGAHVARILDVGRLENEQPYLVMEYLDGADLGVILEQQHRLPVGEAVDYIIQACEALEDAHRAGVVHRDLKPANLFVVKEHGRRVVKLVDFGISRFDRPNEVRVTQTHTAFGTPLYMAPESVRSAKYADARTDIWALGVILYELLSGIPPFLGETPTSVAVSITIDKQKPLSQERLDVPVELDAIIAWALEKDPARRPQTATELADALRPFRDPARFSLPGAAGGALAPGDPQATTARSMTPGLARTDQTMRTGDPVSGDIRREKKNRVALVAVVALVGCFGTVAALTLARYSQRATGTASPTADEPGKVDGERADGPVTSPAVVAPNPTAAADGASTAAPGLPATPASSPSATASAPPATAAADASVAVPPRPTNAPQTPTSSKPNPKEAPVAPGGNPLIL